MTSEKREGPIKQVTVRQDGPVLLAEGAMALLLADLWVAQPSSSPPLCGVQVIMRSHDGEMNGWRRQPGSLGLFGSIGFLLPVACWGRKIRPGSGLCTAWERR